MCLSNKMNMYSLSEEQKKAVHSWRIGDNVRVIAVAGAGKSTIILQMTKTSEDPICILTYNKTLQKELEEKLKNIGSTSKCFTFHGLAGEYISICQDDNELANSLSKPIKKEFPFSKIIIDEAQDIKKVYVELISKLAFPLEEKQICIVGDPHQMLYDYDPDDSAVIDVLQQPSKYFAKPFVNRVLSKSFRLTPFVADFANRMSATQHVKISPGNERQNHPVEVKLCGPGDKASIALAWILKNHPVSNESSMQILSATRKKNNQLKRLVNQLSLYGYKVYVHLVDSVENKSYCNLHCTSYHSAKGAEAETVVIIGFSSLNAENPLHVALTRSKCRLFIVADKKDVHPSLAAEICKQPDCLSFDDDTLLSATEICEENDAAAAAAAAALLEAEAEEKEEKEEDEEEEEEEEEGGGGNDNPRRERAPVLERKYKTIVNKTDWTPLGRETRFSGFFQMIGSHRFVPPPELDPEIEIYKNVFVDVSEFYIIYAKTRLEMQKTKNVRFQYFIVDPVPSKKRKPSVLNGIEDALGANVYENDLIPSFAISALKTKFKNLHAISSIEDWFELSVIMGCWNKFHNKTQLLIPSEKWVNAGLCIDFHRCLRGQLPDSINDFHGFAIFARSSTLIYKSHYFAKHDGIIYQVVYEDQLPYQEFVRLALPAIFSRSTLKIINMKLGESKFYEFPKSVEKTLEALNL